MHIALPVSKLNSDDLPTLGRPTMPERRREREKEGGRERDGEDAGNTLGCRKIVHFGLDHGLRPKPVHSYIFMMHVHRYDDDNNSEKQRPERERESEREREREKERE